MKVLLVVRNGASFSGQLISAKKQKSGGIIGCSAGGPGGPGGPDGPTSPFVPSFPVFPFGPGGPCIPGNPEGPSLPFGPIGPEGPGVLWTPRIRIVRAYLSHPVLLDHP